jgi:hypothetical protein
LAFPELRILGLRAFVQGIHDADLTKRARDNLIATRLVIVEKEFDDYDASYSGTRINPAKYFHDEAP